MTRCRTRTFVLVSQLWKIERFHSRGQPLFNLLEQKEAIKQLLTTEKAAKSPKRTDRKFFEQARLKWVIEVK